jgi:NAD(P)-dependent dehydrogenase (short-subunit alcohol dehydrogenase family)
MNRLDMFRGAFSLEGKVALVPGGAGEIGQAVGEALCAYGAKVILTGRTREKAETAAGAIRNAGGQAEGRAFTVAGAAEVENLVDAVYKDHKKVDILVNCVGKQIENPAEDYKEQDWDDILNINLKTAFFFSKEVGRRQIAAGGGGKHVHITSVRGLLGINRGFIAYCSSKGGMVMMIRQLASEWTKHKINVNGIAPTFIRTAQVAKYLDDPNFYKPLVARIPLGRVGDTHEVAGLALYLAAPISDFVSGQIIYIDGGLTAIQ